ncbi:hypothetical protein [Aliiroseovarius crassostreae]|uniref:hypothetical protein n=1 Tax=Aliiroseovarius crassostreae TaxID=154981 RepID=UPI003C7D52E4
MIFASIADNSGRAGPHARRALAILDLGCVAGFGLVCFEPLLLLIYLLGYGVIGTVVLMTLFALPLLFLAGLALRAFRPARDTTGDNLVGTLGDAPRDTAGKTQGKTG